MGTHVFRLASEPLAAIIAGNKTIESRLYDTKRRAIRLGDVIVFEDREDEGRVCCVRFIDLLRYDTFADMFAQNDATKFGGESAEWLLAQIRTFYTPEDENKYGVLGIVFEKQPPQ